MFVAEHTDLLAALIAVAPFAGGGAAVTLSADDDGVIEVIAGTGRCGARTRTQGRAIIAASVSVGLRSLLAAVKSCRGGSVEVAGAADRVAVVVGGAGPSPRRYTFPRSEDGCAPPAAPDGAPAVELDGGAFARLVERIAFATRLVGRPGATTDAVEMVVGGGVLEIAATNAFQLVSAQDAAEVTGVASTLRVLVPAAVLNAWGVAAARGGRVRLTLGDVIGFHAAEMDAWAARPRGTFPAWRSECVKPAHIVEHVPVAPLLDAIRGALAMVRGAAPQVTLSVKKPGLLVAAGTAAGRCEVAVPVSGVPGPQMQIPLDGQRLVAALESIDAPTIAFAYGDGPVVVAAPGFRLVQVPRRERV